MTHRLLSSLSTLPELSPMLTETQLEQWRRLVAEAQRIVICTHKSPDGDALCSSLALAHYLQTEGKIAAIAIPDAFPDFLQWLPGANQVKRYDKDAASVEQLLAKADLIFCLDINTTTRVATMQTALDGAPAPRIVVDHHTGPDINAALLLSQPHMSSATEMIFRIVSQMGALNRVGAQFYTCCYCGMMTDTGNFAYNCSYADFFHIIAYLVGQGVDKEKISHRVYNSYSADCLRLRAMVISEKMRIVPEQHAAYFVLTADEMRRYHYVKGDAEGLVNEPLRIKDILLSISLREDNAHPNLVWVSLRSAGNYTCHRLAERYFNGGGHPNAAGGKLLCSIQEAERIVQQAINNWMNTQ